MKINVNDELFTFNGTTVLTLMEELQLIHKKGIALAINQTIVPKNEWGETFLNENDSVLIITAAAGG